MFRLLECAKVRCRTLPEIIHDGLTPDLPREAIAALEHGNKIEAIKFVRMAQGVGLKEAKGIVEAFIEWNPSVKCHMASANAESA